VRQAALGNQEKESWIGSLFSGNNSRAFIAALLAALH
jgi:hypothetical protein